MKNSKSLIFVFFLLLTTSLTFAQTPTDANYSTIFIKRPSGDLKQIQMSLFVANQIPFSMEDGQVVAFKIYSEGQISIRANYFGANLFCDLHVKRGNDYYVNLGTEGLKIVDTEKKIETFKMIMSKKDKILQREENLSDPIYQNASDGTKKGGKGQASCFLISTEGYLITNFHCIENAKDIYIKGIDGDFTTKYGAIVVASDPSNDLALLKLGNKNLKFNTPVYGLRSSGILLAEKIYALGYPIASVMGREIKVNEGIISSKSGAQGDISKLQISAGVNPGNSGGPLIDENGNLIGVIFAKSKIAESAGYAIKASYLETFLKNVENFKLPEFTNTLKEKSISEKITEIKSFIFIIETE